MSLLGLVLEFNDLTKEIKSAAEASQTYQEEVDLLDLQPGCVLPMLANFPMLLFISVIFLHMQG